MQLCSGSYALDFKDSCVRGAWIARIPLPKPIKKITILVKSPFQQFLTLEDALEVNTEAGVELDNPSWKLWPAPWVTVALTTTALFEVASWVAIGACRFKSEGDLETRSRDASRALIVVISWIYAAVHPLMHPMPTPPYDLFIIYIIQFIVGAVDFGGMYFDHNVHGKPVPTIFIVVARALNLCAILALLVVVFSLPVNVRNGSVDGDDIGKSISPEDYTSLWGWASFYWVHPLIRRGTYMTLNEPDVWSLSPTLQSRPLFLVFSRIKHGGLVRRLLAANSLDIILDFSLTLVSVSLKYLGPFFLKRILDAIDNPTDVNRSEAYIYASLAFSSTVLTAEVDLQHMWHGRRAACRVRSELIASIYDKALKRRDLSGIIDKEKTNQSSDGNSKGTKKSKATADDPKPGAGIGKIVNLMSGDAHVISLLTAGIYYMYGAPIEIIIAATFLYQHLGLRRIAVLVLAWPLNSYLSRRSLRIYKGISTARDKRMAVTNELIGAIKFIKFFAWEDRWIQRALDARKYELSCRVRGNINSILITTLSTIAPILVSIVSFLVYVIQGNELTVGIAFTAITLFSMIKEPLYVIPRWIVQLLSMRVSLNRIEVFLNEEEVTDQVSSLKQAASTDYVRLDALGLKNASFKNGDPKDNGGSGVKNNSSQAGAVQEATEDQRGPISIAKNVGFELKDLSIIFPEGKLTVVTGPTASGKTALLLALLGEMTLLPGGEIIMTKDQTKVNLDGLMNAVSYAAQTPWLQHQSIKDNILFGFPYEEERYKAVIECCALCRTWKFLKMEMPQRLGPAGKQVALARAVYARANYVLLDDPLSAVDSHTSRFLFDHLLLGSLLKGRTVILVTHHVKHVVPAAYYLVRMVDGRIDTQGAIQGLLERGVVDEIIEESASMVQDKIERSTEDGQEKINGGKDKMSETAKGRNIPRTIIKSEGRATGSVKWAVYKTYLQASSYRTWAILVILIALSQLMGVNEKAWIMGYWVDLPSAQDHPLFYVGVYGLIGLITAIVRITSSITQFIGALRASRILFRRLLFGVVRATMRWHDVTPIGRMVNRFSNDIQKVDTELAASLESMNTSLATFLSSAIVVVYFFPWFIIPATVMGSLYYKLAIGYLNTGRDLRRMESTTLSPVFSGFRELLEGIVTVGAFSAEQRFLDGMHKKIDLTTQMWYTFWMTNRWLLINFDCIGGLAVLLTTLFVLGGYVRAGVAGLCITLNSVERVVEYLNIPQEPPLIITESRPPAAWPTASDATSLVVVGDLVVKYAPDLPSVLHGVSFALKARERVGLLGRTGSGKSTLAMSLLRFTDPASGRIIIDGIDITTIGVHDLRSRVTFILQDATLFSGTIRENLDPFSLASRTSSNHEVERENTNDTVTPSIARSPSVTEIDSTPSISLDTQVSIIIQDEATSSIDFAADAIIQKTIREQFSNSLLITVAHRIQSVIDYDRLIVLDKGTVTEFDSPYNLLQMEDGIFRSMCLASGSFAELRDAAKSKAGL
ncbi:hypothetical protein BD410DRAFT_816853 [Rickenella mellea]|uniref:P-loop containing nucleoside triphosphate hydrolase protein n=1 Tax=Rickenella mellea TaxID=50990 RepID=A0A4Y7PK56_9AGAM|nr:hypothetical protein BD410DRAFT_816853 [Rickenella mellea]